MSFRVTFTWQAISAQTSPESHMVGEWGETGYGGSRGRYPVKFFYLPNSLVKLPELLTWFKKREREREKRVGLEYKLQKKKDAFIHIYTEIFFFNVYS